MQNGLTGICKCLHCQQLRCSGFEPSGTLSRSRRGFTILELLVTFSVISTLVSLILPAIGSAREAARQLQCKNQLKQIGLALHSYHETNNCLPPGWQWEASRKSAYSWTVTLLPYMEQHALYEQIDRNQILEHPINESARYTSIPNFLCPSDITEPRFMLFKEDEITSTISPLFELPTANYIGVFGTIEPDDDIPAPIGDGTFLESRPVRFSELRRGLSNTIIVGERTMSKVPSTWLGVDASGEDATCRLAGMAMTGPNCNSCDECEFSSRHPGGANFLWADGRVRMLSENISADRYQQFARRTTK